MTLRLDSKLPAVGTTIFTVMSKLAADVGAINLSQGFPDFDCDPALVDAVTRHMRDSRNQYAPMQGVLALRQAIAAKYETFHGRRYDPETEVTVTSGGTEAIFNAVVSCVHAGDEVIVLEPFYENYGPDAILAGATPVFVPLERPDWRLDPDRLRAAFSPRTKAIIVNTPHNPSGRVLTRAECDLIASLCIEFDAWAITDEIYEHIRYAGDHHVLATWPGMRDRTVTISGLSKTFSCTGWRLGYAIAPADATLPIRKVHDFLTVGAPAPLQAAGAVAMAFDADYYNHLALGYRDRRETIGTALQAAGFTFTLPEGAYYILADFSRLSELDDVAFAKWMTREIGVATVPGSSFYHDPALGKSLVRFAFCKSRELLLAAAGRLGAVSAGVGV